MIDDLIKAVQLAGDAILTMQREDLSIHRKTNNDMVTGADLMANAMLKQALLKAYPQAAWLSEESTDDKSRLTSAQVFIIDPIDGTKEYAANVPEYAISVALVEKGKPTLAVVYNPAKDQLFHAIRGGGAWLNQKRIHCREKSPDDKLVFLASRSEVAHGSWDAIQDKVEVKSIGSIAYKLGLLAAGEGDATGSLGPKNEWDIAAGALIVEEAGGCVTNKHGEAIVFNQSQLLVDGIIASTPNAQEAVFKLINKMILDLSK